MHLKESLIAGILIISWCTLHSFLISPTVSGTIKTKGGIYQAAYRLTYNIFSVITLMPLAIYIFSAEQSIIFTWQGGWRIIQISMIIYAAYMFLGGSKAYNGAYFLGIKQWRDFRRRAQETTVPELCTSGALRYVRHPWYSGGIALIWTMNPLTDVGLVSRIIITLYIIVGAWLEERKIVAQLGDEYRVYQRRVSMLWPDFIGWWRDCFRF